MTDTPSESELIREHERLTTRSTEVRQQRKELVWELSFEHSQAHEQLGSIRFDSVEHPDRLPFSHRDSKEKRSAIREVIDKIREDNKYQELSEKISALQAELYELWDHAAEVLVSDDLNKRENIGVLWAAFGEDVPNRRVAEAVGCHEQYPGRLVFDPETETVDYKDHVKQRKENQVRTNHRQEILERDGNACVRCGVSASDGEAELIIHHIAPVSEGGSAEPENLATLCSGCHSSAHDEYGSGEVFYSTNTGFWQWAREGGPRF
jgi:5-methylcytosine-specific restriction endonuclease McrA